MGTLARARTGTFLARAGLLGGGVLLASACTKDAKPPVQGPVIAAWEFPPEPLAPLLRLWPADAATPPRKDRGLSATNEEGRLSMLVDGDDPRFSWVLDPPIAASVVDVEVEAGVTGGLQLFRATSHCSTFSEACSATANLVPGRNVVSFLLDPADPLRSLRLDPPEGRGNRYLFHRILLAGDGAVDAPWTARETVSALEVSPMGLRLIAALPDPGMTVGTPGLDASRVTAIELVMHGSPSSPPQLFWDGPCHSFSEECSALLLPADAGATTHRALLKASGTWTGRINTLRLDPGPGAGEYVVERVALVHDPLD
jgi:hypothetical protein